MFPSLSATSPCGPEFGVFSGYSLNSPVFGSRRPSLFAACPVYQSEPSGASAGSCGRDFGVGTSYSLIWTFSVPTAGEAPIVAASANQHSLPRCIVVPLSLESRSVESWPFEARFVSNQRPSKQPSVCFNNAKNRHGNSICDDAQPVSDVHNRIVFLRNFEPERSTSFL